MLFLAGENMENQDIERTFQSILNQQAQFISDLQQLREVQSATDRNVASLTEAFLTVTGLVGRLTDVQTQLLERQAKTAESMSDLARQMADLARSHVALEERFNAFVAFMERYLSDRGGGRN
jgi:septation ring formation regulator EzrA